MSTVEYSENTLYRRATKGFIISWIVVALLYIIYIGGFTFSGGIVIQLGGMNVDMYGALVNLGISAAILLVALLFLRKIWFVLGKHFILFHLISFGLNFAIYAAINIIVKQGINFPPVAMIGPAISMLIFMSTYNGLKVVGEIGDRGYITLCAFTLPTWSATALSSLAVEAIFGMTVIGRGGITGIAFLGSAGAVALITALFFTHYRFGTKEVSLHMP